jgi:hypothetical protein
MRSKAKPLGLLLRTTSAVGSTTSMKPRRISAAEIWTSVGDDCDSNRAMEFTVAPTVKLVRESRALAATTLPMTRTAPAAYNV